MITQGRSSAGAGDFRTAADYPLPSTRSTRLWLRDGGRLTGGGPHRRCRFVRRDRHLARGGPAGQRAQLQSAPLARATRLVGSAVLRTKVRVSSETMHLTPVLVDVAPDGSTTTIERGFLHLDYRNGLDEAEPSTGRWLSASVRLLPQDYTVAAGHRIGLRVQSSNTVWAVPGNPGTVDVAQGSLGDRVRGSSLSIPTIGDRARFR